MAIRFEDIYERGKKLLVVGGLCEVAFCYAVEDGVVCCGILFSGRLAELMLAEY